ncbi:MAG: CoA transferase [Chloroflexota bacterium]
MAADAPNTSVLRGLLVLDMTQALAGPYLTMLLGDLGADVIKVERPGDGDQSRGWGPPFAGSESSYYMAVNRNKRSLTCDLKTAEGLEILRRLTDRADLIVTNERRQATRQQMGFDYETVRGRNPGVVYCSITGYGMTGPYAGQPGYDAVAQAMSGLMSIAGNEDWPPMRVPASIADMATAMYGVMAVLAALLARQTITPGQGQYIDLSLLESHAWWTIIQSAAYLLNGHLPRKLGNEHPSIVPYGAFQAADGYLIIGCASESLWASLCRVLDLGPVRDDPRFAINRDRVLNRAEINAIIEERLSAGSVAQWCAVLGKASIPSCPIYTIPEMLSDPQTAARGFVVAQEHPTAGTLRTLACPIHLSETPAELRLPPPLLGEHTDEVLRELGYRADESAAVHAGGAV